MSNRLVECYDQKLIVQVPSIFEMTTANTEVIIRLYAMREGGDSTGHGSDNDNQMCVCVFVRARIWREKNS